MNDKRKIADTIDTLLLISSVGVILLYLTALCLVLPQLLLSYIAQDNVAEIYDGVTPWIAVTLLLFAIPTGVLSLRAMRGRQDPRFQVPSISPLLIVLLFPGALILGHIAFELSDRAGLLGSFAHITSAAIPAWFAILLAYRFGPLVSQRRFWGSLFLSVWVIPLTAVIMELLLIIIGFTTILIGSLSSPEVQALLEAAANPENWASDTMFEGFLPIFNQPSFIILAIAFTCIIVPLLEEALKTMAIWPLLRRKLTDAESFLSGILGGAGFAFVEALFGTPTGPEWTQTMFVRGGATMMHTFTAGLTCWGIGQVMTARRWKRFMGAFAIAIAMHGLWNAAAIGVAVASSPFQLGVTAISPATADIIMALAISLLVMLTVVAVAGIFEIPRRFRVQQEKSTTDIASVDEFTSATRPEDDPSL